MTRKYVRVDVVHPLEVVCLGCEHRQNHDLPVRTLLDPAFTFHLWEV